MNSSFQSIGRRSSTGGTNHRRRPRRRPMDSPARGRRHAGRRRQADTAIPASPIATQPSIVRSAGAGSSSQASGKIGEKGASHSIPA